MKNNFPLALLSVKYHNDQKKNWCLIKLSLSKRRDWFPNDFKGKLFFHREIVYIDDAATIVGIGESWIKPKDYLYILKMMNPFKPKPLGIVLRQAELGGHIKIEIIEDAPYSSHLVPYRIGIITGHRYRRRIGVANRNFETLVEEILENSVIRD